MQHRQTGTLGHRCQHQVSGPNRAMPAAVRQKQHDLGSTIEVGLMRWHQGQRSDELFMDLTWVTSAEQGFEVEDATACHVALPLQVEELAGDDRIGEAGVDAAVQQMRQSPHAWRSTSSLASSIPPS